jgi:hypothetical protein
MDSLHAGESGRERGPEHDGKGNDAVAMSFRVPDDDSVFGVLDVLDAQPQALEQPHAAAIEEHRDEARRSSHPSDHGAHLRPAQNDGQPPGPLRAHDRGQTGKGLLEDVAVEEEYRRHRLVLRGRAHAGANRQVRQERVDFGLPHLEGMSLPVKKNEPPDPGDVGLLRPKAVVPGADGEPHPVEQPRGARIGVHLE